VFSNGSAVSTTDISAVDFNPQLQVVKTVIFPKTLSDFNRVFIAKYFAPIVIAKGIGAVAPKKNELV
jgi:hypothetical protein